MIRAVLFDADGVVQQPRAGWIDQLGKLSGRPAADEQKAFVAEIFASEQPSLSGQANFPETIDKVLRRWGSSSTVHDVISVFFMIDVIQETVSLIREIRALGTPCYLASNQEANRASYMSVQLGYAGIFDTEFYSCGMGAKKPEAAYFAAVADGLSAPPEALLLFDDKPENVDAARNTGMAAELYHHTHGIAVLSRLLGRYSIPIS
jgi:putative hydrolase of the HAD superfamily